MSSMSRDANMSVVSRQQRTEPSLNWTTCTALLCAHMLIGFVASDSGAIITAHAAVTTVIAVWVVATTSRIGVVLTCAAYVVGSEVFWRLPGATVPWMWGTYLASALLIGGWFRLIRAKADIAPMAFLACLAPGAALTVLSSDLDTARDSLAFNISGPVLLAVTVSVCSRIRSTREGVERLLWWLVAATLLVSGAAISAAPRLAALDFTSESNLATSAGFGPNQVSLVLGVGVVATLLIVLCNSRPSTTVLATAVLLLLVTQAVLTFSRTGPFLAVLAAVAAVVGGSRSIPRAVSNLTRGALVVVVLVLLIGPRIESLTGGQASQRFGTAQTSHRDEIAAADLSIFADYPLLGTGVGGSPEARARHGLRGSPSHTEQTRLLAEHGLFGLVALALLIYMAVQAVRRQVSAPGRRWALCWAIWSLAAMTVAANRLGVVPYAFGLGAILILPEPQSETRSSTP